VSMVEGIRRQSDDSAANAIHQEKQINRNKADDRDYGFLLLTSSAHSFPCEA